jgi:uncharacterized tellurite resistance protein B-like protein
MRTYPIDSPQAKSRIIALTLLADGGLDKSEIECLESQDIVNRLGIASETFDTVMREFCEDLDQSGLCRRNGQLDLEHPAIEAMLNEIRQRNVRQALLRTIFDIVHADSNVSQGEAQLTSRAMKHWGIRQQNLTQPKQSYLAGLPPQVRKLVAEACS